MPLEANHRGTEAALSKDCALSATLASRAQVVEIALGETELQRRPRSEENLPDSLMLIIQVVLMKWCMREQKGAEWRSWEDNSRRETQCWAQIKFSIYFSNHGDR